ncbi:hypothetical protein [Moraxella catarrhalis]|nr:hypothetical protein [Moraxella catarrhalis]
MNNFWQYHIASMGIFGDGRLPRHQRKPSSFAIQASKEFQIST